MVGWLGAHRPEIPIHQRTCSLCPYVCVFRDCKVTNGLHRIAYFSSQSLQSLFIILINYFFSCFHAFTATVNTSAHSDMWNIKRVQFDSIIDVGFYIPDTML